MDWKRRGGFRAINGGGFIVVQMFYIILWGALDKTRETNQVA
jgi:hypothetical protein